MSNSKKNSLENLSKSVKFNKAIHIFIIVSWTFIFADSLHSVIVRDNILPIWVDITFIVLAVFIVFSYVTGYRKKFMKQKK